MRVLLLSGYDAQSHKYWREGLERFLSEYDPSLSLTQLVMPPRHFNWRIRGNGLYWGVACSETLDAHYDLLVATSMVDLATLRGLKPELGRLPTILYFHENQFAYPVSHQANRRYSPEPRMVQLYAALAADALVFNSVYNRDSFIDGVAALLKKFPDYVPSGVVGGFQQKSRVLPVPLRYPPSTSPEKQPRSVIWNHRWEYDKGPEGLLACIQALPADSDCIFHIVGQSFRKVPPAFAQIKTLLQQRGWLGQWGFVAERSDYWHWLARSHCVLSTSLHEFQGLSVLEAVSQGCLPVVPDRLAYRELFEPRFRYASTEQPEEEAQAAAERLLSLWQTEESAPCSLESLHWSTLGPQYHALFAAYAGSGVD